MKGFFNIYQYIAPVVVLPLAYWLWLIRLEGQHSLAALVVSIPVVSSYVIPALGTNYFKLWEFRTRFMLGRFRPHHGFVFGAGTSAMALICTGGDYADGLGVAAVVQTGLVTGTFFAFWNWVYDIYAIKTGFMVVHNRVRAAGGGPEAVAMDYAPLYFGLFGACFGIQIRMVEYYLLVLDRTELYWWFFVIFNICTLAIPPLVYMGIYYLRHGEYGVRPHVREDGRGSVCAWSDESRQAVGRRKVHAR